ncbi:MAG: FAD-dependent oxidoreductase [Bacilli bacterium]|nr:FAD-dependent oxidoreductase [Bacilli bacterium]
MFDVIVIGAGVAGMTAALNARRGGKSVLILEQETIGGQIAVSPRVENIPSIKEISGEEYSSKLFEQVTDLGAEFELEKVESVTKVNGVFQVKTDYNVHESLTVILACGVKPRHIGVEREDELVGHGVSYCAVCDGAFFKGEDVALIGDANTALQYALQLSSYCNHVYICALFDHLFADEILCNRVRTTSNISIDYEISLKEFLGDPDLNGLVFENTKTHELKRYDVKAAFIAIGQVPDNERYSNLVDLEKGYIVTNELMETKTPGLYAAGDCRVKVFRQVVTAESDGMTAALRAINYINSH